MNTPTAIPYSTAKDNKMTDTKETGKTLTGRKFLAIMLVFYALIIGVNGTGAYFAISTFPGLEIKNTYVASQVFNAEKAAQLRLGWTMETDYDGQTLTLVMNGPDGKPANIGDLDVSVGRATHANDDVTLEFAQSQSPYSVDIPLDRGKWEIRLKAKSTGGVLFRQRHSVIVTK
jgi:nitrogen fixation protein FixH